MCGREDIAWKCSCCFWVKGSWNYYNQLIKNWIWHLYSSTGKVSWNYRNVWLSSGFTLRICFKQKTGKDGVNLLQPGHLLNLLWRFSLIGFLSRVWNMYFPKRFSQPGLGGNMPQKVLHTEVIGLLRLLIMSTLSENKVIIVEWDLKERKNICRCPVLKYNLEILMQLYTSTPLHLRYKYSSTPLHWFDSFS